jgi:glycosyltransferase involved in cell wall biosynthesis
VLTTEKASYQNGINLPRKGFEIVELPYKTPKISGKLRERNAAEALGSRVDTNNLIFSNALKYFNKLKMATGIYTSNRMPDLTDFWVRPAIRWCRASPPWDVIVSSSGPYTVNLVAEKIKRIGLAKYWVADFRDLWVDNHIYNGLFPFTVIERILEKKCLFKADLITTVSDELANILKRKTKKNIEVIYNGFEENLVENKNNGKGIMDNSIVRLAYTGTIYPQGQDPTPLLKAFAYIKKYYPEIVSKIKLIIAGVGTEIWINQAKRCGVLEFIENKNIVSRNESLKIQKKCNALVLLDWQDPTKGVITGKLFEYLIGSQIILVIGGKKGSVIDTIIKEARRGIHLESEIRDIVKILVNMVNNKNKFVDQRNKKYIETFSRKRQALRLLELIKEYSAMILR